MSRLILFNKPFGVLCQFRDKDGRPVLGDYLRQPDIYPAGRLDHDSEGLLLLTDDGVLQARIADPRWKLPKTYWVQVEGDITDDALARLSRGVTLNDGPTLPAEARRLVAPDLWERHPPIRYRAAIPTSWIAVTLREGRNRQVRRMTAAVGFPTLRLVRVEIGPWSVAGLAPGEWREIEVSLDDLPGPRRAAPPTERPPSHSRDAGKKGNHPVRVRNDDRPVRPQETDRRISRENPDAPSAPRRPHRSPSPRPSGPPRSPTPSSRKARGS